MVCDELVQMCLQSGISQGALNRIISIGKFQLKQEVSIPEFLALLLTTTVDNFTQMVSSLFEVFGEGGKLDVEAFLKLFNMLSLWDSSITEEVKKQLAENLDDTSFLTFAALGNNPVLAERLTVA
eukprot:TRINITY_DN10194_c0_g1_i1.p3 TRINITY_DN10194_c0_g1~~TRINITY_DN10194_c0_g1_i1.p3  ORF type:complete len:125 (-),score=29.03 TRINITY_DN10194_c0_g1_i1:103-477(-)